MRLLAFSRATAVAAVAIAALVSGCGTPDSARAANDRTAAAPASTVSSSNGTLGATAPRDSLTDRADRGRILGDTTAPVWLIMASDFQCPFCKQWHDSTYGRLTQEFVRTGKVRLAYMNYPLPQHRNAMPAAEAAMCAAVQGKFWEMHEALFAAQDKWSTLTAAGAMFDSMAVRAGVGMPAWRQCVNNHSTAALITADRERAASAGVRSTPTFFVGDQKLEGVAPYPVFRDAVESAVAKARGARGQSKSP